MATPSSAANGITFRTEFAVAMTCASCVASVNEALKDEPGVDTHTVSLADQRVVVEGRGACADPLGLHAPRRPSARDRGHAWPVLGRCCVAGALVLCSDRAGLRLFRGIDPNGCCRDLEDHSRVSEVLEELCAV